MGFLFDVLLNYVFVKHLATLILRYSKVAWKCQDVYCRLCWSVCRTEVKFTAVHYVVFMLVCFSSSRHQFKFKVMMLVRFTHSILAFMLASVLSSSLQLDKSTKGCKYLTISTDHLYWRKNLLELTNQLWLISNGFFCPCCTTTPGVRVHPPAKSHFNPLWQRKN